MNRSLMTRLLMMLLLMVTAPVFLSLAVAGPGTGGAASPPLMAGWPEMLRSELTNSVELSKCIVTAVPLRRHSRWVQQHTGMRTTVVLRARRVLKGCVGQDSLLTYEYDGGEIAPMHYGAIGQFIPEFGHEYLLFLARCGNATPILASEHLAVPVGAAVTRLPGVHDPVPCEELLDSISRQVMMLQPASLVAQADLVVQAVVHAGPDRDIRRPSVPRAGRFALTVRKVLANGPHYLVSAGDTLSAYVGRDPTDSPSILRSKDPSLADGSTACLFLRRTRAGLWRLLQTPYACWRVDDDSVRVIADNAPCDGGPAVLAAMDTTAFTSAINRVRR
jgi:hypothetical protein